jgi:uncharacterized protein (TIGR00725 family)
MEKAVESVFEVIRNPAVAVIGSSEAATEQLRNARRIGRLLAESGATVVTGGRGGVMEAACQGACRAGGLTLGILPGGSALESPPNPYVQVPVFTGMGEARNVIVVRTAGAVIAVGGGYGTLSEIGLALKAGRPVILLDSWGFTPAAPAPEWEALVHTAENPQHAVELAIALAGKALPGGSVTVFPAEDEELAPQQVGEAVRDPGTVA